MLEKNLPITGGCLCGAIRYEATEEPEIAGTCHCRTCQKSYGGPFTAAVGFRRNAFSITKGELKYYQSSKIARRAFCSECGSPIMLEFVSSVPLAGEHFWVRLGTLDNPEKYRPEFHYGVEAQLPWIHFDDGLPRISTEEGVMEAYAAAERHDTP